jgi:hypothetical protein
MKIFLKTLKKKRSTNNRHRPNNLNNYKVNSLKINIVAGILSKIMVKLKVIIVMYRFETLKLVL